MNPMEKVIEPRKIGKIQGRNESLNLNTQKKQVNYNIWKEMIEFCSTSTVDIHVQCFD